MAHPTRPTTALVLAGGKGERLRPLTNDRPKPMVEVAGAPILVHHLSWLRNNGVERAIVLTGYLHEVIDDYFRAPRIEGLKVECVAESSPLGRGGAFKNGARVAGVRNETVVATNGDVITDQPLSEMFDLHRRNNALVTLLLTQMISPYGIVEIDDDARVQSFVEKPALPFWINAGVYLIDSEIFERFPEVGDHETTTFPELAAEGRIAGLRGDAFWSSVESLKDLRTVGERLAALGKV